MVMKAALFALLVALSAPAVFAQDGGSDQPATPAAPRDGDGVEAAAPAGEAPATTAPDSEKPLDRSAMDDIWARVKQDQIKVLAPNEVPGELARLKSKADIKAEVSVRVTGTRPVVFRGVIRNGKLIELLGGVDHKHFVPVENIEDSECGVRLWWSGDSDGYIFFRYSSIEKLALTGLLTEEERTEILRRLRARREGTDPETAAAQARAAAEKSLEELGKMPREELKKLLLGRFPYDAGWTAEKRLQLKLKQVRNEKLTPEETIFLKYYSDLRQARFDELKARSEKTEIEPGSEDDGTGTKG